MQTVPQRESKITLIYDYRPQRSWGKVMFLHMSVILFRGGVSRPTPGSGEVEGSGRGVGLQAHTRVGGGVVVSPGPHVEGGGVCIPASNEADTPHSRRLLLRAVRILLECILVLTSST